MRTLTVSMDDVLSLIHCAEDYGFENDVLFSSFRDWLDGRLSDEEIDAFANDYLTPEMTAKGYGEEDAENARNRLREFRRRYLPPAGTTRANEAKVDATTTTTPAIDEVARLRDLLKRCESGARGRFPQCPICEMKWFDGPEQEHAEGCELAAVFRKENEDV